MNSTCFFPFRITQLVFLPRDFIWFLHLGASSHLHFCHGTCHISFHYIHGICLAQLLWWIKSLGLKADLRQLTKRRTCAAGWSTKVCFARERWGAHPLHCAPNVRWLQPIQLVPRDKNIIRNLGITKECLASCVRKSLWVLRELNI